MALLSSHLNIQRTVVMKLLKTEPFTNMLVFVLHLEGTLRDLHRVLGLLSDCSVVIELTAFTFKTEQRAARYTKILFLGRFLHSGVFAKIFKFIKNAK